MRFPTYKKDDFMEEVRLNKWMTDHGFCSRREAENLITTGRLRVNGQQAELGQKVTDNDQITLDGKPLEPVREKAVYLMLNKPLGYITTSSDPHGRKTVLELIDLPQRVYPIGRLDFDTEGLLLLTNDGELTQKLTHPSHHVDKVYHAVVMGLPTSQELDKFAKGLIIDGKKTSPAKISLIHGERRTSTLEITIHEGRNRQVRKMCDAIGHRVTSLKRVGVGGLTLGKLKTGCFRHLTPAEVKRLKNL